MRTYLTIIVLVPALLVAGTVSASDVVSEIRYEYEDDVVESSLIMPAKDLRQLAMHARKKRIPLVIEFSTPWCEYCEALEQQVLEPILRNASYDGRLLLRKVVVDDTNELIDFNGDKISASRFATANKIDLYPTLAFYTEGGKELAERIIGITVLEFVPDRIDRALDESLHRVVRDTIR